VSKLADVVYGAHLNSHGWTGWQTLGKNPIAPQGALFRGRSSNVLGRASKARSLVDWKYCRL